MKARNPAPQQTTKDPLVTRPDEALPTPLDPAGPKAKGYPADPKPDPQGADGQGDDPHAGDLDHSV